MLGTWMMRRGGKVSWREVTAKILRATGAKEEDLVWAISSKTQFKDNSEKERILAGLRWIGLFSDEEVEKRGNSLDTLRMRLEKLMAWAGGIQ
jgi:saccharopine dehydrogenase (NADP+, L-glutamate forming)